MLAYKLRSKFFNVFSLMQLICLMMRYDQQQFVHILWIQQCSEIGQLYWNCVLSCFVILVLVSAYL